MISIIYIFLILLAITAWIQGGLKKGRKGNRSAKWFSVYLVGIGLTVLLALPFIIGSYDGFFDSYYVRKAEALMMAAKTHKDPALARQAVDYARKSLPYGLPDRKRMDKDYRVLEQARQTESDLQSQGGITP